MKNLGYLVGIINVIILSYKFGQSWDALTLQDSWNGLQFGMEGVLSTGL